MGDAVTTADLFASSGAEFSACRRWRYHLWREWGNKKRRCIILGLNPSTATELLDDATIRRCIGYSKAWGFGAYDMLNLFAWRSTDPTELLKLSDTNRVGPDNDEVIRRVVRGASRVVLAWGSHKKLGAIVAERAEHVRRIVLATCPRDIVGQFGTNADGQPKHPLYLPKSAEFQALSA